MLSLPPHPTYLLLLLLLCGSCVGVGVGGGEAVGGSVGSLVRHIVETSLHGCHLVVMGYDVNKGVLPYVLRSLDASNLLLPRVVVNLNNLDWPKGEVEGGDGTKDPSWEFVYLNLRMRTAIVGCWAMVVALEHNHHIQPVFRFLEWAEIYRWPETYLLFTGPAHLGPPTLDQYALRNAAHLLYLSHPPFNITPPTTTTTTTTDLISETLPVPAPPTTSNTNRNHTEDPLQIEVLFRCLYCDDGRPSDIPILIWSPANPLPLDKHTLFPKQFHNLGAIELRVVTMNWFPFIEFERTSEEGGTLVIPMDSLDYRMLQTIAAHLNFTFEMRVPFDNQWGTSNDMTGNWTGIVGTLQHQKADFSMMLSWLYNRLPVIDYSRIYESEPLVMVTSKPQALPQALALVRPFAKSVWMMTLVCAVVAWLMLWGLQEAWTRVSGGKGLGAGLAALLTFGILLEDPPPKLPNNITAQMLLGWWWVYCMLLTIVYRSSLIAHLTVPGKSSTLESLEDLLVAHRRERWTWGYEPTYGSGWEWLKINESPMVKEIFDSIMLLGLQDQLDRVLVGRHAFITWKYYIRAIIGARYTDSLGYTPIHTAREDFFNYGGYGWGYRQGAPFRLRIDTLKGRLIEAGLITCWMDQLQEDTAREARALRNRQNEKKKKKNEEGEGAVDEEEEEKAFESEYKDTGPQVVLGLGHLQGIFYLLTIGNTLAFIAFLGELFSHARANAKTNNLKVLGAPGYTTDLDFIKTDVLETKII